MGNRNGQIALGKRKNDKEQITSVALSPKRNWIAVGGYNEEVQIWDWKNNQLVAEIKSDPDMGTGFGVSLDFSADGKWLAIGQDNRLAQVYDIQDWSEKWKFEETNGSCGGCGTLVEFSPNSNFLLRANRHSGMQSFDLSTGEKAIDFRSKVKDLSDIDYSEDGKTILLTTEDSCLFTSRTGS